MEREDVQKSVSLRKVALRELPNGGRNVTVHCPMDSHPSKRRSFTVEFPNISGVKRSHPDSFGRHANLQLPGISADGQPGCQLRNTVLESCNLSRRIQPPTDNVMNSQNHVDVGPNLKGDPCESANPVASSTFIPIPITSTVQHSSSTSAYPPGNSITGVPLAPADYSVINGGIPVDSQSSRLHWKERFLQLQAFLKAYDHSSQEKYIRMLRSLSAAGRSKHAVELEKRAIQLLIEEDSQVAHEPSLPSDAIMAEARD